MSLTCALLATLLQQWARRYITITQPSYGPRKRARIRAFFAEGLEKRHLHLAVEALPILLHISLFLFFAGLLVFLSHTDSAVFGIVTGWVCLCLAAYTYITLTPIFRQDSPYCSPFSSPAWSLLNGTIFAVIQILHLSGILGRVTHAIRHRIHRLRMLSYRRLVDGMVKTAGKKALAMASEIDARALMKTFRSLDEDHELERFFAGIPGLCNSKEISNPFIVFIEPNKWALSEALVELMHRTLTSSLVSEPARRRRALICTKAAHTSYLPIHPTTCEQVINGWLEELLNFVEFGHFLMRDHYDDPSMDYYSTCMISIIIARVKERDDEWGKLAMGHLGISAPVLRSYLTHGDSTLLANYIHTLRSIVHVHFDHFQSGDATSRWKVLESAYQFNIQDTLPSLQHEFCDLWNEIMDMARTAADHRTRSTLITLLKNVRRAYIALHENTDSAPMSFSDSTADDDHVLFSLSSYPLCNIPGHRPFHASHFPNAITLPLPTTQQSHDFPPFPMPHNTVPSAAPSGHTPQNQMNLMCHQFPPTFASTSHSALDALTHGVANLPVPPQPVHSSSFSGITNPLCHAHSYALPLSVAQDASSPTFSPVFDNIAIPYLIQQDRAASQPDDARTRSQVPIPLAACPAAFPVRPASAVYEGAAADGGEKAALCKGKDTPNLILSTNAVTAPPHSLP